MANGLSNVGAVATGTLTDEEYGKLPGLQGPQGGQYQIAGLGDYQNEQRGLSQGMANAPDLAGATAGVMGDQQALQNYIQSVAMGHGETAADQMLRNAQVQQARQSQSLGVSMGGGMNPALAMRGIQGAQAQGMGDIAGKSALQKLQEQQQYSHMAQAGNAQLYQQKYQQAQQTFQNEMAITQAKSDIANRIFDSNRYQTSFNMQLDQNRQAFSNIQRLQAQQQAADMARSQSNMIRGIVRGGLTVAGGVVGGIAGGVAGFGGGAVPGAMGGAALGTALGGVVAADEAAKTDPALLAALSKSPSSQSLPQMTREAAYQQPAPGSPTVGEYYGSTK